MIKALTLLTAFLCSLNLSAEVIHSERSLYRNVIVEDNDNIRCLKFSVKRKTSSQSCINKNDPQALVFSYTKLLFASFLIMDKPENVLVIGLGGGTMSNSIHELYPDANITNVEIDPAVVKVAREYFEFIENDKINTETKDGRIFIKRAKIKQQQYDWIILDAFNGDYIPEHLLTKEFLTEVYDVLTPDGVLSANTFSSSGLYKHESATYHAVFGDFFNVRFNENSNRVVLSKKSELPNAAQIQARAQQLRAVLTPYSVDTLELAPLLKVNNDWPKDARILTDQFSPANLLK